MRNTFIAQNPSVLWFLAALGLFTFTVTMLSEVTGIDVISTSFVKTLGKTLCLCLVAIAMDVVWGYCGILSLGHFAFFGIGGYAVGMWLMYARTEGIVLDSLSSQTIPPTPEEISDAIGNQIFGVVGSAEFPLIWAFADSLFLQLVMVVLVPGLLALVFGWLAFRSRVTGVALALGLGYVFFAWVVSGKMGSVIKGIRDNEARVRFLGYHVESYKLFVFTITAIVSGIAGALYYPQAGIINPGEIAPIASIYLAVWVAIGGRGRLYGAVIGAAFVSLMSSWFTGGGAPDIPLGFYTVQWTDWWLVLLGFSFVAVTLFFPKGIGGLFDYLVRKPS